MNAAHSDPVTRRTARDFALVALAAAGFSMTLIAQTPNIRPGKYEVTSSTSMAGRASTAPGRKAFNCITAEQLTDMSVLFMPVKGATCTVSNYKMAGAELKFTKTCTLEPVDLQMTLTGDVTFPSQESYHGVVNIKTTAGASDAGAGPQAAMRQSLLTMNGSTVTTTANRVGDCTK